MTEIRKLPVTAGAEWLLTGFGLLRRAPLALGLLGLIWGGLSGLASMTGQLWLSMVLALLGPVLFGGLVYATREVAQGRRALPAHLVQGLRDGKLARLLAMLLPQVAALVLAVVLLFVMLGTEQLQQVAAVMQQMQSNPDPQLAQTLPAGRLFAWLLAALAVGLIAGLFTFVAIPEVMFTERGALDAMKLSFRACVRNLAALVVLVALLFIAMLALSLAMQLVITLLTLVIGAQPAVFVGQLLLTAVLLPVLGGVVYQAWQQMLGAPPSVAADPARSDGFEA